MAIWLAPLIHQLNKAFFSFSVFSSTKHKHKNFIKKNQAFLSNWTIGHSAKNNFGRFRKAYFSIYLYTSWHAETISLSEPLFFAQQVFFLRQKIIWMIATRISALVHLSATNYGNLINCNTRKTVNVWINCLMLELN